MLNIFLMSKNFILPDLFFESNKPKHYNAMLIAEIKQELLN